MRVRTRHYALLTVLAPAWTFLAGCGQDNAWTASRDDSYSDDIQKLVEDRIVEQSDTRTATQRWEKHKAGDYQTGEDGERDREKAELERKREEVARKLIEAGPLSLIDCLAYSLVFNDEIRAARATVRSMDGEKLIVRSRFLPRLTFDLSSNSLVGNVAENLAMGVRGLQTLLEVGKDNALDVALRTTQRDALFSYEQVAAGLLSEVRTRFYTILLRKQQLVTRRELLREFTARYERMQALEKKHWVVALDVLTAEMNVLNEGLRINLLEKEILRQKMDLLKAVGFPVGMTDVKVAGEQEAFGLALDEGVRIAIRRSTAIAQARATVFEQDRVVRQIIWEYLPSIDMHGGYRDHRVAAGGALETADRVYSTNPFAESLIRRTDAGTFGTDSGWLGSHTSGWYLDLVLELPIFSGLQRTGTFKKERALLDRARHLLCNATAAAELDVRKAYQTVREREMSTNILRETVRISKRRLELQERLKERGRISDDQLETFRERFFNDQDAYFNGQVRLVEAQEALRTAMRYFEPLREQEQEKEE